MIANKLAPEASLANCHWQFSPRSWNQNPLPYHLANPQYLALLYPKAGFELLFDLPSTDPIMELI
jgi:hypothetical protein